LARNLARRGTSKSLGVADAKAKVIELIQQGYKVAEACGVVQRSQETYRDWQKKDPEFKAAIAAIRTARAGEQETGRPPVPDFPEFCEELGRPMAPHHRNMWDVINHREPSDMHPSFKLQWGVKWDSAEYAPFLPGGRVVVNVPPGFAKTTTMSIMFAAWLIHKNPDIRIIVVARDQGLAKQILGSVKHILTSGVYRDLHLKYGPETGWKDNDQSWTQTEIYVQGRGSGEKDPTLQATGIGGRVQGQRADVIILDDTITRTNVADYERQQTWLEQEVESRLDGRGLLAVYGTRMSPTDMYSTLRDVTVYADEAEDEGDGEIPRWTYFSMPAVLDYGDGNWKNWVSLWPERFPPNRLRKVRTNETIWALTYQQQDVAEDATFNARAVEASVNSLRFPGPLNVGAVGHRANGMEGLYLIGTVDPAPTGFTAMIVGGVEKATGKRYILDGFNHRSTSITLLKDTMKRLAEQYHVNEWVIETNAAQKFIFQDADLTSWMRGRGIKLTPHNTQNQKLDPDFGVMAMAPLFMSCGEPPNTGSGGAWKKTPDKALIELPSPAQNAWVSELMNQLVVWQPSGMKQLQKTDLVMALWFFDIAARKLLGHGRDKPHFMNNPYSPGNRLKDRRVVNMAELRAAKQEGMVA
jgi:hypothetical protein